MKSLFGMIGPDEVKKERSYSQKEVITHLTGQVESKKNSWKGQLALLYCLSFYKRLVRSLIFSCSSFPLVFHADYNYLQFKIFGLADALTLI